MGQNERHVCQTLARQPSDGSVVQTGVWLPAYKCRCSHAVLSVLERCTVFRVLVLPMGLYAPQRHLQLACHTFALLWAISGLDSTSVHMPELLALRHKIPAPIGV